MRTTGRLFCGCLCNLNFQGYLLVFGVSCQHFSTWVGRWSLEAHWLREDLSAVWFVIDFIPELKLIWIARLPLMLPMWMHSGSSSLLQRAPDGKLIHDHCLGLNACVMWGSYTEFVGWNFQPLLLCCCCYCGIQLICRICYYLWLMCLDLRDESTHPHWTAHYTLNTHTTPQ